ncbi:probable long-chain-alcohol O-fatty-acyltransferase 2 [Brassica napus]|uniref:probable long-chain-alcohol O-fatty-acyltransferase 2 n=1 Tax=Brassica napus TaxID=3708 RepID=UPI002078F88A|nr:probable long-chain-alcohol O-fatty-acyltransferase 2 [Brassica napus]
MEEELRNLIKVWISAFISISYCYYISSRISKGFLRLLSLLPIFIIFLLIPLLFSSVHFCVISAFFLTWLANFKLALFAFDQEPLSPLPSTLSRFFCFACFPIKTNQKPSSSQTYNKPMSKWVLASKVMIFSFLLQLYSNNYHNSLSQLPFLAIFTIHIYLEAEFILFSTGTLLSTLLGCEIERVFNEPYLATSLQDFWSRRWNRMVPSVLRPTVQIPVQQYMTRLIGPNLAFYAGVLATFLVSGLMHELIYFYIIRKSPTWEVTCFFVLHGVVTSLEIWVKQMRLCPPPHRAVSSLVVVVFVFVTAGWLFTPQVLRNNVHKRVINECLFVIDFVKSQVVNIVL